MAINNERQSRVIFKQENTALYLILLFVILILVTSLLPNTKVQTVPLIQATIKVNPNIRIVNPNMVLPPEKSKPYSYVNNNRKFKSILQYTNRNGLIPEINRFSESRKESIVCLALNIYHEARGSSISDQKGVGYVTINRVKHDGFPSNICEVVWQSSQFSWTFNDINDILPKESSAWIKSQKLALDIYKQKYTIYYADFDITRGAMHFYAPKLIHCPIWARADNIESKTQIGGHMYVKVLL